ncbi:teichoic acid biosynthesis protein F [Bacillus thuringiensis]|uniref:bifunctional glycosyltransferase/CDP-glycerol:glycerophosphate glycerophosphotransferase n=1 Tax=Bacillus tropicus TaxID=2026188 RepID=UPI000B44B13D|nr:bifunctional glycosyltransferase family 2 protein/CDP-glycerol:glycerophosphate glycerophosphotransferase [Bacillus tropicus]MED3036449.1 bifunctional glycosyltransferase family 2 protein/CDP-glycerol:glycerophosphate glycerophosphotransferase [Bacillus tropicus]OTX89937.1 teichoic acid biosynthesis protein F [Bacillus thuringiensis serovar chanpaisis]PNK23447.1 teichoic acid biosynthesis protein F [Bacillus thuringiensis]
MKTVSVIVPVYNKEDYLKRCINSVLNQTYTNLEIILINDGSTDNSKGILTEFVREYEQIRYYEFQRNYGVAKARNYGLSKATGEYVYFLDADDYLMAQAVEVLVDNIGDYSAIAGPCLKKTVKYSSIKDVNVQLYTQESKIKMLRGKTVLNILFSNKYIRRYKLKFDEEVSFFSDLTFLIPLLAKEDTFPMINLPFYIKGECYEPIDNPTLSIIATKYKIHDFFSVYKSLKVNLYKNIFIYNYLDELLLSFYFKNITTSIRKSPNLLEKHFNDLKTNVDLISLDIIKKRNFLERLELQWIKKGNKKFAFICMKVRTLYKRWKKAFKGKKSLYHEIYRTILVKLPMNEKTIVFESFAGKSYSCNPRYIYEYLVNSNQDFNFVWIFNELDKDIPGNAKKVKRFSWKYYYYLAKSKYWVTNTRMPNNLSKRKDTIYLQTWHGTPLKKLAADMKEVHMPGTTTEKYKKNFYNESRNWDYLVSPNQYSTEIFKRAFKYNQEIVEFGYPRNDILCGNERERKERANWIKSRIGIPKNKKVILYAPTWRDDEFYEKGKYRFELKLNLKEMQKRFGDQYVIVLRMHYLVADHVNIEGMENFVYELSKYEDIAELYLISDILITDYSSVFFDYANLRRPILFFTYDISKYRSILRGFYMDFEKEAPGPLLETSDQVINAISNIESIEIEYKEVFNRFYNKFCHLDNGMAAKRISEKVFK